MVLAGESAGGPYVVIPEEEVTANAVLGGPENGTADHSERMVLIGWLEAVGDAGCCSSCSMAEDI